MNRYYLLGTIVFLFVGLITWIDGMVVQDVPQAFIGFWIFIVGLVFAIFTYDSG